MYGSQSLYLRKVLKCCVTQCKLSAYYPQWVSMLKGLDIAIAAGFAGEI